jgi:hypothetical protein
MEIAIITLVDCEVKAIFVCLSRRDGFAVATDMAAPLTDAPRWKTIARKSSWLAAGEPDFGWSGGGGNRTRVRGRTGESVYKLRLPLEFARRPVCSRPTAGLAILRCRTSGDWLSFGAEPVRWRRYPSHGPSSERRRHLTELGSECEIVLRTYVVPG